MLTFVLVEVGVVVPVEERNAPLLQAQHKGTLHSQQTVEAGKDKAATLYLRGYIVDMVHHPSPALSLKGTALLLQCLGELTIYLRQLAPQGLILLAHRLLVIDHRHARVAKQANDTLLDLSVYVALVKTARLHRATQYSLRRDAFGTLVDVVEVGYQLAPPAIEGVKAQSGLHLHLIYII